MSPAFEEISHTADNGIRAYGSSFVEVLRNAADGMFSLILSDREGLIPEGTESISLEAESQETLLHAWLTELLFLHSVRKILPVWYELSVNSESMVHGQSSHPDQGSIPAASEWVEQRPAKKSKRDAAIWKLRATLTYAEMTREHAMQATEIKAVTWHAFSLHFDGKCWCAETIFDS